MINILHIINGWPSGGITEQVYLLCKHLPKDKFRQYSIGYCHFDGGFVKKFEDVGVECIHSDESYSNLSQVIKMLNIDIVHKQTGGGDFPIYAPLLKEMGVPLVESLHCPRASGIPVELLSKIIYTTPYTLKQNSVGHQKIMESIMYSVDLHEPIVKESTKKELPLVVGRLSRIVADKRPDILLELAKISYQKYGDSVQFKFAGQIPTDYPEHIKFGEIFKQLVEEAPNCEYVGFVENKYDFWKSLDICINPLWESSFDIVFLEAMSCGVPILTWDNSAAKYVVGNAGIITEENIKDMFDGLDRMILDSGIRKLMGDIGIKYIEERYSLKLLLDKYEKMYQEVFEASKI